MKAHLADLSDHRAFLRTAFLASSARTMEEFCDMISISRRTLLHWHKGRNPTKNNLTRIAQFLSDTANEADLGILYRDDHVPIYVFDKRFYLRTERLPEQEHRIFMMGLDFSGKKGTAMGTVPFIEHLDIAPIRANTELLLKIENWSPQC